jgi:hypothetical protein
MRTLGLLTLMLWSLTHAVLAAEDHREERVHFKVGTEGATVKGRIEGRGDIDYILGAKAGQRMSLTLHADHPQLYFNVLPPGSEEALFVGSTSGDHFEGSLPKSGDYRIRVYLMRAAARRHEAASYRLDIRIEGETRAQSPDSSSPVRPA